MSCEDDAFFEHMHTCREPYRKLAACIHEVVQPHGNVLDRRPS